MKKLIPMFLMLCICLALTGCTHDHIAETMWSVGLDGHWHSCEKCDEQLDYAVHAFGDDGTCTVCTAGIYESADGTKEAKAFDDHGSLVLLVTYDAQGNIATDERYDFEYYEDGCIKNQKYYSNRVLANEDVYLHRADADETYHAQSIFYYKDVSTIISEYSEDELLLKTSTYDANGKLYAEERYEYEFDADGKRTKLSIYVDDVLSRVVDDVNGKMLEYDSNGEIKTERAYTYDENGNPLTETVYVYGRLDVITYYTLNSDGACYVYRAVYYDNDGNVEKEVHFNAEGKEIR